MNAKSMLVGIMMGALFGIQALAAGSGDHAHGKTVNIGHPGKASKATQTVKVAMYDYYYNPKNLSFKGGETVRLIVKNAGEFVHEFNIATAAMHKAHAPEMMMMVEYGVLEPDKINWDAAKAMQKSMRRGDRKPKGERES